MDGYSPIAEVHIEYCEITKDIASKMSLHITGSRRWVGICQVDNR